MIALFQSIGILIVVIAANLILLSGFSQLESEKGISCAGGYLLVTIAIETIGIMLLIGGAS